MNSHSMIEAGRTVVGPAARHETDSRAIARTQACLVVVRMREMAAKLLGNVLSGDPYWDALLDMYLAETQHRSVYQSAIRIRELSQPSAHRHSVRLEQLGAVVRLPDTSDYRRRKLILTAQVRRSIDQIMDQMLPHGPIDVGSRPPSSDVSAPRP